MPHILHYIQSIRTAKPVELNAKESATSRREESNLLTHTVHTAATLSGQRRLGANEILPGLRDSLHVGQGWSH